MTKNLKDLRGPALALVLERLKTSGLSLPDASESAKPVPSGPASKSTSKIAKPGLNGFADRGPKHGSKSIPSVCFSSFLYKVPAKKLDAYLSICVCVWTERGSYEGCKIRLHFVSSRSCSPITGFI